MADFPAKQPFGASAIAAAKGPRGGGGAVVSYLMQANDSVTAAVYSWFAAAPDFAGAGYPGPNSPTNVVVSVRHI